MNAPEPGPCTDPPSAASELVSEAGPLVSPPEVLVKVMSAVSSDTADAARIGAIVARDPSLTARLLRLVNSSYYGFRAPIETVDRAVNVLGTRELVNLVTAVSAVRTFSGISAQLINMDSFWRHSLHCGLLARQLARQTDVLHPDRLFVCGLLHDLGILLMVHQIPDVVAELLLLAQDDEEALTDAEFANLGFTHADVGAVLLGEWNLSDELQQAVRGHHNWRARPAQAGPETALVRLANSIATASGIGGLFEHSAVLDSIDATLWSDAGLDPAMLDSLSSSVAAEFSEAAAALLPR